MYNCVRGILGGRESTSGKVRGRFEKKQKNSVEVNRFSEGANEEPSGEPAPDPPVGILYGTLIILLLEPV